MITSMTDQFCSRINLLGYKSGFYCNYDFQNNYMNTSALTDYELWFADWDGDIYENCYIQQYTDKGNVDGINDNVDLNYYIATQPEPTKNYITVNDVVNGIWDGDFGNGDERKDNLYNYFQNKVNEGRPTDVKN
jgi:GH25 family lysozyme M1 (1,4-beta-N-acetylmuramidase)